MPGYGSGDRMWGQIACFFGVHEWSGWEVPDLDQPAEQVRTCARCGRQKTNAVPAPFKAWIHPLQ